MSDEEPKGPMKVVFAPQFKNSFDKLFSPLYAPLRAWKAILRVPREIKWKWQRMQRGWADSDTWGMYWHLSHMIPEMIRHIMTYKNSYPAEFKNTEEWCAVLEKIAAGFELKTKWEDDADEILGYENNHEFHRLRHLNFEHSMAGAPMSEEDKKLYEEKNTEYFALYHRKEEEVQKQFEESFDLLKRYFFHLWD